MVVAKHLEETKKAWKKVLRPRVLITTTAIVLLLFSLYSLFLLYKVVTADLTIMFWPNDVYTQDSQVTISLRANNYLLCQATCDIVLLHNNDTLSQYTNISLRNNEFNAQFDLLDPPQGEGKEVYSVQATCVSTGFTACYRDEGLVQESAMVVHSYSLSSGQERAREELINNYSFFVSTLQSIDEAIIHAQRIEELLLLPYSLITDAQITFEELLEENNRVLDAVNDWEFLTPPLTQAQELNKTVHESLVELQDLLVQENLRREAINNITIDEKIAYILRNSSAEQEWDSFFENYEKGIGSLLPLQYSSLEQTAIDLLEQNLSQGMNITNATFEEQWLFYCNNCTLELIPKTTMPLLEEPEQITSRLSFELLLPKKQCPACTQGNPVLFLHGHSMNERNDPEWQLGTFTRLVDNLSQEDVLLDAGVMTPHSATTPIPRNAWEGLRVGVRGTYYYDTYFAGGSYVLSTEQSESIDTYAIRTRELVNTLQERTGASQVDIVAHSMGGLVARRYAQLFGDDNIGQIITIGTPHYGTKGSVARFCPVFGADKECVEMREGSSMLARINDPARTTAAPIISIVGSGCDTNGVDGDGIVTTSSASLEGSQTHVVSGSCEEDYYHSLIVTDEQVIALVKELLG